MTASGKTATSVTDFLRDLARSQLFSEARLAEVLRSTNSTIKADANKLAEHLVERQLLTLFQAEKLLRGQWQGLKVGPYELLCPVGRGAMGIVYLARCRDDLHFQAGRLVALKVLPPKRAKDEPRTLARFHRESYIGLKLPSHPNLTRTHDAGEDADVHYLAMEYVPGKNLRQMVHQNGPLKVEQAARLFAAVAAGLNQAHRAGFVHRDLKPANIVVLPHGQPKILDFGFALMLGEQQSGDPAIIGGAGYTVGTMDYLAPEQAVNAATVTPLADVYSLGCCLYFALTGQPPFPGGTAQEKIRSHRSEIPRSIKELRPDVAEEFVEIVNWCLAKKPDFRPESMGLLAKQLEDWAELPKASPIKNLAEQETLWLATAIDYWKQGRTPVTSPEETAALAGLTSTDLPQPILVEDQKPSPLPASSRKIAFSKTQLKRLAVIVIIANMLAFVLGLLFGWLSR